MIPMPTVTRESLEHFVFDVLRAMGLPQEEAEIFGGALVFSELRFHPGHGQGVKKLGRYRDRFTQGLVDVAAPWEVVKESPALALVDAHNGIGTVAATRAMRLAIEKAKVCGIGQVVVRDSTHFGSSAVHACLGPEAGCIGIGRRATIDDGPLSHDGDVVGGVEDLVELVAHEGDRPTLLVDDAPERLEELFGLPRCQDRGRLVEHHDPRIATKALHDLDPLPETGRQVGDDGIGLDVDAVVAAQVADPVADVVGSERADVAEGHVLPDGQRLDQAEVLVDHADAQLGGGDGVGDDDRLAGEEHLAGVRDRQPDQDLHQRRLPGTVLAEHTEDAAGFEREVDRGAGDDLPVALGDVAHLDRRWRPGGWPHAPTLPPRQARHQ